MFVTSANAQPAKVILSQDFTDAKPGAALPNGISDNSGWASAAPTLSVVDTGEPGRGKALQVEIHGFAQFVLGRLPVEKGTIYRVEISLRALGTVPVQVFARKMAPPYTKYFGREVEVHEGWRDLTFVAQSAFTEPQTILIVVCTANTTLWIDKYKVEETDETPHPQPPPRLGNLLQNSGFELGTDGWLMRGTMAADTSVAHSGHASLRLEGDSVLSSTWYPVGVGSRYTLSAWMKCEGAACTALLSVSNWVFMGGGKTDKQTTMHLQPGEWHRMSFDWTVPFASGVVAETPSYYINFRANVPQGARLWVDDLTFAAGDADTYEPRAPLELSIVSPAPYSVYTVDEPVTLTVHAAGKTLPPAVQLVREDEQNRIVAKSTVTLTKGAGIAELGKLPPGYWRFVTNSGRPAAQVDEGELLVSVAPRMPNVPVDRWRVGCHIPNSERALKACWRLGMRWNRLHDTGTETKWDQVEPSKGQWTFDDASIDAKTALGFGIPASLDRLPAWLSGAKGRAVSAMAYPTMDTGLWEEYIRNTVSHWKGRIHWWEIMNEPNGYRGTTPAGSPQQMYVHMLQAAYRAMKQADPTANVLGIGGATLGDLNWVEPIFAAGALNDCDAVSFHGYGTSSWSAAARPETLIDGVQKWRDLMRKYGREVPIWDSEVGIELASASHKFSMPGETTPEQGMELLPKMIACSRAAGVARLLLYSAHELTHAGSLGLNFVLDFNNQMKPAAVPIAVATSLLEGTQFAGLSHPDAEINQLSFHGNGRNVTIVWATQGTHTIPVPATGTSVWNEFGRAIVHEGDSVKVGSASIYIVTPSQPRS